MTAAYFLGQGYRIKIPSKRDFRSCVIPAKAGIQSLYVALYSTSPGFPLSRE